jgi:cytoskeletal protein CcmA (bactofilin family)
MEKNKTMSSQATVIGAQTHVKGNLEGDEDLHVVGRIDGNISLTKSLVVDPSGIVVADVQVAKAVVSGTVVGNITATDLVHITEQGRVVGDLHAPRVILVDGASFRGNVEMGDMEAPRVAGAERVVTPKVARPAPASGSPSGPKAAPAEKPSPAKSAPRPAPPPKRVVEAPRGSAATSAKLTPATLEKRAEAAAQAVAARRKDPPTKKPDLPPAPAGKAVDEAGERAGTFSSLRPPRPPTTAGKKTKVRRK